MKTYKYKFGDPSNTIRLGNLLDDMWQVHEYFHKWQRHRYQDGLPYAGYEAMCLRVTELKRTTHPHWKALPSQAIQEELKRIHLAYERFFKRLGGRPKIKKRHKFKSFTLKQAGWSLKDNRLTLNFRKWEKGKWRHNKVAYTFRKHRDFYGTISRITIKRDACGDYWLYIITEFVETKPLPTTGKSVGETDFGMKDAYLTLSTGEKKHHPQPLKRSLNKLRSLNKSLSRKVRGSNSWWRCVRQLARLYRKISNQRKDFQWQLASDLCKKFDTIAIETLNLDGMKRLWGRKVSDLGFYQFVQILKYKCQKHGRKLLQVGQWTATTKPCSDCGFHNENLTLKDRQWTCPNCGSHHDRDINAAVNILRAGIAVT
ncbi:IS200/IS605 family element transposase accessory protein TnpB [Candidatus Poribacteria bacterium]|nr:IS200/IS605 family element transposase accessory protein TnpB [Candidatus Poribacteria bacterium]